MPVSSLTFFPESVGHLLADRWLSVPPFQRPYAWDIDNVEDFWNDLENALDGDRDHFLGAVVITRSDDRYQIIDGQQRLATTSLLLAAIRDELSSLEANDLAKHVEDHYLRAFNRASGASSPRLQISPADASFYLERFILRAGDSPRSSSQQRLLDAFQSLRTHAAEVAAGEDSPTRIARLTKWIDLLDNGALIVLVETDTTGDAFQIFETLNDRGAPLTIADLLKNYLMSLDPETFQEIQDDWDVASANLGVDADAQQLVTYLRYLWSSIHGATRERDLYASLRHTIDESVTAHAFSAQIADESDGYAAILDPGHEYWSQQSELVRRSIATLNYLQLGQYRPLMLTAITQFEDEALNSLAEALVNWTFRGLLVGGIGGGTAERAYANAAVAVRSGTAVDVDGVFRLLRPIVPSDEEFRSRFEVAPISRTRIAHYALRSLNRARDGQEHASLEVYPEEEGSPVSFPLLPSRANVSEWRNFASEDSSLYVHRIGNLVLRPPGRMSLPGSWVHRKRIATEAGFPVNEDLDGIDAWSPDTIKARQIAMAELALIAWPREPR